MEKDRWTGMHGFVKTPFCRVVTNFLVFLMVIQGWPLWELSQSYKWVPDKFCRIINHVVTFMGPEQAEAATVVFGPKQYHRTEGKPNIYTDSFAGIPGEGNLVVQNGDQAGNYRISSAIIMVNGVQVLGPNDFNQQEDQLEAPISLGEDNSISLELRGKPNSYLTIKITSEPQNYPPVANGGPDQTAFVTDTVQLDGSGSSDLDGDALTYEWSFLSMPAGSAASLSDTTVVDPTFVVNLPGTYVVQLIVNDGLVDSDPDTVTISTNNSVPVANAGPDQTVFVDDTVTLDAGGSTDVDGDLLSFTWSFVSVPDGSIAGISDPSSVEPTFVVDMAGTYVIQLIVTDGFANSDPDTVTISTENRKPVANAGPDQTVFVGDTITLDGSSSSDVDGDLLTFMWSFASIPEGSAAALSDPAAVNPTFDVDKQGTYVVQLVVNDGILDSEPDTVTISTENRKPVADAGPDQTVFVGDTVTLDGSSSSDVDGDLLTFMWSLTSIPDGSMAALSDPTAVALGFDIDEPGIYVVQLIVNDSLLDSDPDTVTISTENRKPVADAGPDQTAFVGNTVTLDGSSSSDVDGDLLTFNWSFTSIPNGSTATLSDPAAVNPTFVIDEPGSYVVQLIVNDGTVDSDPDSVTITTENSSPVADAGPDQTVFVTETVQLNGSGSGDADGDSLTFMWSFTSRPAGSTATLSDSTIVNPTFVTDLPGTYTVQLIVNDATVDSDPDSVVISTQNSRPLASAGSDQAVSIGDTVALDGSTSSDVDGDPLTYQWSFTSIPSGSGATLSDPAAIDPTFEADLPGTYVIQLIVNDGTVNSNPDTVTITATEQMIIVPDLVGMEQSAAEAAITAADLSVGNITTQNSATVPAGNIISQNPVAGVSVSEGSAVDMVVSLGPVVVNRDPEITSIPLTSAGVDVLYTYDVDATDPDGDTLTYSLNTAPSGMVIDSGTGLITWTPGSEQISTNDIEVQVSDSRGGVDTQSYTILVSATANRPPEITSSPVTGAATGVAYQYDVEATDQDGYPLTFSLTQAPAGMVIDIGTGLIEWMPDTTQIGPHDVTVMVEDTLAAHDTQSFTVTVASAGDIVPPEVTITVNPLQVNPDESVTITVDATDDVGVVSVELLVNGTPLALDVDNQATFSSSTSGLFTATATAHDAQGNAGTGSEDFNVLAPGDNTSPTVSITSPPTNSEITVPTPIIGTASDENLVRYRLELSPIDKNQWTVFAEGTTSVTNGELGTFDPTQLLNGLYNIRLTAEDANGQVSSTSVLYRVAEDLKVGNFSITLQDLSIPVAGLPITINRTYDTRDKGSHDFGYGWSLAIQTIKIEENRILGTDWTQSKSGWLFPTYYLYPNGEHYVSITLPDGRVEEFDFTPYPTSKTLLPILYVTAAFTARPGTFSTLVPLGNTNLTVGGFVGSLDLIDGWFGSPYNPDGYQLTTVDGTVFVISQTDGIKSITDPNGNTITFNSDGIIHSSGKGIVFTRDAQGRITHITDPNGGTITYEYDFRGDLIAVTDQEGNTTRYHYNSSHGLIDIKDPRGITPARNIYDDEGRLIAHIDAYGNRIEYTHNVDARQEVVKDRLGNTTVYEYDDDGNVLNMTDPLGNTTAYTYDDDGNKLRETDSLGNITTYTYDARGNQLSKTDPQGNKNTYTYNGRNQLLTKTDALGNTTTVIYDADGNLLSRIDALGNTTVKTYDSSGNLASTTDCLGHKMTYEYDSFGNRTKEIDTLGNETTYTYDANGNELIKTATRTTDTGQVTMTTIKEYDNLNRVIKITDPYGKVTITEYNAIGKESATVDKNGNRTTNEYDLTGNLIKTTYPDGSTAINSYDAAGNRLASTDRAGRTIQYEYDAAKYGSVENRAGNRVTRMISPDGSGTGMEYDAAGRLIATLDKNGNRWSYEYDAVGRRTKVIDALGNVTTFTYDVNGNEISMTDANGNTTIYEYDALNRRIKTIFPDGTFAAVEYAGNDDKRKISETDQAGNITRFEYDDLGRLTKVIDALGGETTYTYDEIGNKLTQTDLNGHTTIWAYDNLGRIVRHTLPMGMSETFTYDSNGNVLSKTDFNGDTITYAYDAFNRLIRKTYPDGSDVSFTYTVNGRRETVADAGGVTSYSYDIRDMLVEVINPDGTTITYTYDPEGNRTSVTAPSGTTSYTYDKLKRLETVTDPDGGVTTYTYDSVGNRASIIYPNGTVTEYTYDSLNRLTYLENRKSTGEVISSYRYTLGPAGNRIKVEENTSRVVNYTYDNLYRLTGEQITDPVLGNESISYTYDAFGNRLTKTDSTGITNNTYNANDQLMTETAPGHTNTYEYDSNGNTISKSDGTTVTDYTYDYENKLVVAQTGTGQTNYAYDADGIRVNTTANGAVMHYLVDKNRRYAQVLEETDGSSSLVVSYVYGDDLISQDRGGSSSYYHYDGQMSTRKLTSVDETITDSYVYDAFGKIVDRTGTTDNNYLYTGEQYDPNVGFYYLRARYYNPGTGRFMTHDPRWGSPFEPMSLHRYLYANANPVLFVDPSGEFSILLALGIIGIACILASVLVAEYAHSISRDMGCKDPVNWKGGLVVASVGKGWGVGGMIAGFKSDCSSGKWANWGSGVYLLLMAGLTWSKWPSATGSIIMDMETPGMFGPNPSTLVGFSAWISLSAGFALMASWSILYMGFGRSLPTLMPGTLPGTFIPSTFGFSGLGVDIVGGFSIPIATSKDNPCL